MEHKINNFNEDLKWIRVGWRASPKAVSCSSISNEINAELIKKGLNGECELSRKTLEYFISILMSSAGYISSFSYTNEGIYFIGELFTSLEP